MTTNNSIIDPNLPSLDIERIKEMLPHRYPFLLIDRVVNLKENIGGVGIKNVTANEPHFTGHFPKQAVMPGVLIIEAMAQTAAVVVMHSMGKEAEGKLVYFMSIDDARFRKPVTPGDQLLIHAEVDRSRGNVWRFSAIATVDGKKVADATYSAMIVDNK